MSDAKKFGKFIGKGLGEIGQREWSINDITDEQIDALRQFSVDNWGYTPEQAAESFPYTDRKPLPDSAFVPPKVDPGFGLGQRSQAEGTGYGLGQRVRR